ncbi:hypothetical protein C8Q74DRAFT_758484 [Fomes fomentarius]|nr:hypothetical protein C8Q74DRAFT_758484 [Fomes fomentarius]
MQLRDSRSPFKVLGNPTLQHILDELAVGCYQSYSRIDLDAMRQTYGISWDPEEAAPTAQAPPPAKVYRSEHDNPRLQPSLKSRREPAVQPVMNARVAATQSSQPVREPGSATASPPPSEPTPSSPPPLPTSEPDPCEMRDYLASHYGILCTFLKYKAMPKISDKGEDQFALPNRAVILYAQDRRWAVPSHSSTIESGSGSQLELDSQAADACSPSPESVPSGGVSNNPKKRGREDEDEAADADIDGAGASGVQTPSRPKRQRGAKE